jgi:hypothetical protein
MLIQNSLEESYLILTYTSLQLPTWNDTYAGFTRNYIFRITFEWYWWQYLTNAWAAGLGWSTDAPIYDYPCAVYGTMAASAKVITCDLHTEAFPPYLDVNGLVTSDFNAKGVNLTIEVPRIAL